jgi:hypothetical protein
MDELIRKLKNNADFVEFADYIIEKIDELDTVSGLDIMTNEQAGEEAKVRSKTKDKLYEILRPFIDFKEKKEITEGEIKKAGEKFGL